MRISVKGRYALATMLLLADKSDLGERISGVAVAARLNISKIYLEQVFYALKNSGLLSSTKGARGGYFLSKPAKEISLYDILSPIETSLVEATEPTVRDSAPEIELAMNEHVFEPLTKSVEANLKRVSLADMLETSRSHKVSQSFMINL